MSLEGKKMPLPELSPEVISGKMMEQLGTSDIPYTYRTANNSLYASDKKLRTVRYRTANSAIQGVSNITVYLDPKYLDPKQIEPRGGQYLGNISLHQEGLLILDDADAIREKRALIKTFGDIPESMNIEAAQEAMHIVVFDPIDRKVIRRTPISLVPVVGFHPVEFFDPQTHAKGHKNHLGNIIEDLKITDQMNESNTRMAIEELVQISFENKKNSPPPTSLDDINRFFD